MRQEGAAAASKMIQFDLVMDYLYLQDNRSKNTYREYVEAGIANQKIAIAQLIEDWGVQGFEITPHWLDTNDEFREDKNGIDSYHPDIMLTFNTPNGGSFSRVYEVKVTDKDIGTRIHIKQTQIDFLVANYPESYIFYSTASRYFTMPVIEIQEKCDLVDSVKIGGKKSYEIWTPSLLQMWRSYSKKLDLVPYPSR